ncbi:hypothetical protein BDV38DRAFT_283138 [Aspergillus pseudotamarii]|uniref:Rhodopsin domain-containing protein n=1 Tax=Aspergillus pseudotamarii TaxID=132259 RepID=A0A5N6SU81_ASPPS|nr:uncharacterized protein BDV38DRAFT_283138 [Aspergillus pseudotamarii]KAE8137300.1 hypothetical protein BDV38DRAFT_283138 [Aspergillus pseudotamarii]
MGLVRDDTWIPELWSLFGVGTVILLSRVGLRCWLHGLHQPAAEDFVSLLIPAFYTVCAVGCYLVYINGDKVDFTQAEINALTDEEARRLILGTKWELVLAYSYPTILWLLKASLLLLYWRLTSGLGRHRLLVLLIGVICLLTYIGVILSMSLACIPFRRFWEIKPLPPINCIQPPNIFIALAVSNVFTDSGIIALPIILLARLQVSKAKKLKILCFLSAGTVVLITAVVRISITLWEPSQLNWNRWLGHARNVHQHYRSLCPSRSRHSSKPFAKSTKFGAQRVECPDYVALQSILSTSIAGFGSVPNRYGPDLDNHTDQHESPNIISSLDSGAGGNTPFASGADGVF